MPHRFEELIDQISLPSEKKLILKKRFVRLVTNEKQRSLRITFLYYLGHTIVSVGSLIVPALLSIQYTSTTSIQSTNSESFSYMIYWTTWFISLLVTTFNALLTLFKIDKKYLYLNTNKELLASEGWQYLQLSGRYSGFFTPMSPPTHENQFVFFCHRIEKIRLHEIEDEYSRFYEQNSSSGSGTSQQIVNDRQITTVPERKGPFNPPTPLNPQENHIVKAEINELFEKQSILIDGGDNSETSSACESELSSTGNGKMSVSIDMSKSFSPA